MYIFTANYVKVWQLIIIKVYEDKIIEINTIFLGIVAVKTKSPLIFEYSYLFEF